MLSEFRCVRCGWPVTVAHTVALIGELGAYHTCDDGEPGLLEPLESDGTSE